MAGARAGVLWGLAAVLACGCDQGATCGDGTYREGDECQASIAPSCGAGTVLTNGACVPDEGAGGECGTGTHLEGTACVADVTQTGNAARFYDVHLVEPHEFVALADASLHSSFMSGANLAFVAVYEPTSSVLRVFGGGGSRNDDSTFTLDRTTSFEAPLMAAGPAFQTGPFTFQLSGLGSTTPVRLVDTVITGVELHRQDGVQLVTAGRLSGVLTPEAARSVYIDLANSTLFDLLDQVGVAPTVDRDQDGTKESWTWTLQFGTQPVWLF